MTVLKLLMASWKKKQQLKLNLSVIKGNGGQTKTIGRKTLLAKKAVCRM
jgi:hypothetical protein